MFARVLNYAFLSFAALLSVTCLIALPSNTLAASTTTTVVSSSTPPSQSVNVGLVHRVIVGGQTNLPGSTPAAASPYVEDEVIVKFKLGSSFAEKNRVIKNHGQLHRDYSKSQKGKHGKDFYENLVVVKLPSKNADATISELRTEPSVEYAERNYIVKVDVIPNDPMFGSQWAADNTGQTGGTANADTNLPEAWSINHDCSSVVVAVIDTGVDYNHPDLVSNMWHNAGETANNGVDDDQNGYIDDVKGWNWVNNTADPFDDNFHGTHVAGIIAAAGNNGQGISGVCWTAKIMPLKFLDSTGNGYTSDAILAIQYATQNGANIINNSWGSYGYTQALQDAIIAVNAAGISVIAAAGNYAQSIPFYPAAYSGVLSVAATSNTDTLSAYSNYGPWISIAAPGDDILSAVPSNGYASYSGTSMAAPQVSGVLALLRGYGLSKRASETLLLGGGDSIDALNPTKQGMVGGGRVNAFDSFRGIADAIPPTPPSNLQVTAVNAIRATISGTPGTDDFKVGGYRVMQSTDNISFTEVPQRFKSFPLTIVNLKPLITYYLKIQTYDVAGNLSQPANVTFTTPSNLPPDTPPKPGVSGTLYYPVYVGYFGTTISDPEGELVKAIFDLGNGTIYDTNWFLPSGSWVGVLPGYQTYQPGTYAVRAMAVDELGASSAWSEPASVNVVPNTPPTTPTISGPTTLIAGQQAQFFFSTTDDTPTLYNFIVDWGDGTSSNTGFCDYGCIPYLYLSHVWPQAGTYAVLVKVEEAYGTYTDGSAPLLITITDGTVPLTADLAVIKVTPSVLSPVQGVQPISYDVWYYNYGADPASGATLKYEFSLPVILSTHTDSCTATSDTVIVCSLGGLAKGSGSASRAYLIVYPKVSGVLNMKATVSANEVDPYLANNSQSVATTIIGPAADLVLTMTDAPDPVKKGAKLVYTLNVKNNGPTGASGILLKDTIPSNMVLDSIKTTQGTCSGKASVACSLGSLSSSASATVTIAVKPLSAGTYSNTANVTATEPDPNLVNNTAIITTTVTQ